MIDSVSHEHKEGIIWYHTGIGWLPRGITSILPKYQLKRAHSLPPVNVFASFLRTLTSAVQTHTEES
jgi:hypothetical protein